MALALCASGGLVAPGQASAQATAPDPNAAFEDAFVFGDSLSDNGNVFGATEGEIPSSPPYAPGRFSNGPIWVDRLVDDLAPVFVDPAAPSTNYAAGGARTDDTFDLEGGVPPGILAQLQIFRLNLIFSDTSVDPNDLAIVWAGANNIFDAFSHIRRNPADFPDQASAQAFLLATSDSAVADMEQAIDSLIGLGARKILVPNLPDLGEIPRYNRDVARSPMASLASDRFNQGLFASLESLSAGAGGEVNIISMDIDTLFNLARTRPRDFGLENVRDPCINQVSEVDPATLTVCAPDAAGQNTYLFWDEIHPTTATHEIIAKAAIGLLTADQAFQTPMAFSEASLISARALSHDVSQHLAGMRALAPVPDSASSPLKASARSAGGRYSLFLSSSYGKGERNGNGPVRGIDYDLHTITAGADIRLGDAAVAGVAIGYARSDNDLTDGSSFDVKTWQGSVFASYFRNGFHVEGSLAHGWLDFTDYIRPTTLAPIRARGRSKGTYWAATGNAGYVHKAGPVAVSLDGGLRYIDAKIDGFSEEDAPILGLEVSDQKTASLAALASLQVSGDIPVSSLRILPYARVTYDAELDGSRRGWGRLIGNSANPFLVDDKLLDDDVVDFDAGILLAGKAIRVAVNYRDRRSVRDDGKDRQFSARLTWSF